MHSDTIVNDKPGFLQPNSVAVEYFWFLAVSDCSEQSLDIESYDLLFTNPQYGVWEKQFSFDRWGIGQTYISFFILYIILVALHLYGCWQLYRV